MPWQQENPKLSNGLLNVLEKERGLFLLDTTDLRVGNIYSDCQLAMFVKHPVLWHLADSNNKYAPQTLSFVTILALESTHF